MTDATAHPNPGVLDGRRPDDVATAVAQRYRPAGVQVGALTTADLPEPLADTLAGAVVAAGLEPARRLARLQPRIGEAAVRPADVVDFLRRYGHEYAVALFDADRWADDDRRCIDDEAARQGCPVLWATTAPTAPAPARPGGPR